MIDRDGKSVLGQIIRSIYETGYEQSGYTQTSQYMYIFPTFHPVEVPSINKPLHSNLSNLTSEVRNTKLDAFIVHIKNLKNAFFL